MEAIFAEVSYDEQRVNEILSECQRRGGGLVIQFDKEPMIRVGLMTGAQSARITLSGQFVTETGEHLSEGDYAASCG